LRGASGSSSGELSSLGKIGKACLGITSGVMGLGITGINDTGMFCLDVDEHVFEGDAVANGVIV